MRSTSARFWEIDAGSELAIGPPRSSRAAIRTPNAPTVRLMRGSLRKGISCGGTEKATQHAVAVDR